MAGDLGGGAIGGGTRTKPTDLVDDDPYFDTREQALAAGRAMHAPAPDAVELRARTQVARREGDERQAAYDQMGLDLEQRQRAEAARKARLVNAEGARSFQAQSWDQVVQGDYANAYKAEVIRRVSSAAPDLVKDDPRLILAAAERAIADGNVDFVVREMVDSDTFVRVMSEKDRLAALPPKQAEFEWGKKDWREQHALRHYGYVPPSEVIDGQPMEAGVLGVVGDVGRAFQWAGRSTGVTQGIGLALRGMDAAQNAVTAAYRTQSYLDREGDGLLKIDDLLSDPGHVLELYRDALDGDTFFDAQAKRDVENVIEDPEALALIHRVAGGDAREDILASYGVEQGTEEWNVEAAKLDDFLADPVVTESVDRLRGSLISPGRDFANMLGLDPGEAYYDLLSGAADAAFIWFTDPTLLLGKTRKVYKFHTRAIERTIDGNASQRIASFYPHIDDIDRAFRAGEPLGKVNAPERAAVRIAQAMQGEGDVLAANLTQLGRELPGARPLLDKFVRANIKAPGDVVKFFQGETGRMALAKGTWTNYLDDFTSVPRLTRLGAEVRQAKVRAGNSIRWLAQDDPEFARLAGEIDDQLLPDRVRDAVHRHTVAPAARAVFRLTHLIPDADTISFYGADTPERITRLLNMGVATPDQLNDMGRFILAKDEAAKLAVRDSVMHTIFGNLGLEGTPIAQRWIEGGQQAYGLRHNERNGRAVGIFITDQADRFAIPRWRELNAERNRGAVMAVVHRVVNGPETDRFMRIWRPAVVLRPAFALRAGLEEAATTLGRYGPRNLINQWLTLPLAAKSDDTPVWFTRFLDPTENNLWRHTADDLRTSGVSDTAILAHELAAKAQKAITMPLRRGARLAVTPRQMRAYQELAAFDFMQQAYTQVGGTNVNVLGLDRSQAHLRDEIAIPELGVLRANGEYGVVERGGKIVDTFLPAYGKTLGHLSRDPIARQVMTARANRLTPVQAKGLLQRLDAGLPEVEPQVARELGTVDMTLIHDKVELSIAKVNPRTATVTIDPARLRADYEAGLPYLRGEMRVPIEPDEAFELDGRRRALLDEYQQLDNQREVAYRDGVPFDETRLREVDAEMSELYAQVDEGRLLPGSVQKAEVFDRQEVDIDELHLWFEDNGGVEAYERFILEHERGHILLGHTHPKGESLMDEAAIAREMEANEVAFQRLDMPFGEGGNFGPRPVGQVDPEPTEVYDRLLGIQLQIQRAPERIRERLAEFRDTGDIAHLDKATEALRGSGMGDLADLMEKLPVLSRNERYALIRTDESSVMGLFDEGDEHWQDVMARAQQGDVAAGNELDEEIIFRELDARMKDRDPEVRQQVTNMARSRDAATGARDEQSLRQWAKEQRETLDEVTLGPNGSPIHSVVVPMAEGNFRIDRHVLDADLDLGMLPTAVWGPKFERLPDESLATRVWNKGVEGGFDILGRQIAAIARQPLTLTVYPRVKETTDLLLGQLLRDQVKSHAAQRYVTNLEEAGDALWETAMRLPGHRRGNGVDTLGDRQITDALAATGHLRGQISKDEAKVLREWWANESQARQQIAAISMNRTVNEVTPYIDDPGVRSQFAEQARNIFPFWFAEEQFYKRWMRTFVHSPEALRKLQLGFYAMEAVGWIERDGEGNPILHYPGSAAVNGALARLMEAFPSGAKYVLPVNAGMAGRLEYAVSGLDTLGQAPPPGPLATVPLSFLAKLDPDLAVLSDAVTRGESRPIWEQVTPTLVRNFIKTVNPDPEMQASAMIGAMQMLAAAGKLPEPTATAHERQEFLDLLRAHTTTLMVSRTVFSAVGPMAAQPDFDPDLLGPKFRELVQLYGIDEGTRRFIEENPYGENPESNIMGYTMGKTENVSNAPVSPTTATFDALSEHTEFYERFGAAGAWLIPHEPGDFDPQAWRLMMSLGIRKSRTAEGFYDDLQFKAAAPQFFNVKDQVDAAIAAEPDPTVRQGIRDRWGEWSRGFYEANPIFEELYRDGDNAKKRRDVLAEIRVALGDDRLPPGVEHADQLRELLDVHDTVVARWDELNAMPSQTEAVRAEKKRLKWALDDWASGFAVGHPTVEAFWRLILEPELQVPMRPTTGDE